MYARARAASPVYDDVREGRWVACCAQDVCRVDAVRCKLRQDAVAQAVAANLGDERRRQAQARGGGERVGAVAAWRGGGRSMVAGREGKGMHTMLTAAAVRRAEREAALRGSVLGNLG